MEKLTFFISLLLISLTIVTSTFTSSQIVLARNSIEKSNGLNHFSPNNYNPLNGDDHPKSFHDGLILLPFSAPKTTADLTLTSSFDNIINTQIYTGLNK
jgi:hypothetical protein